MKTLCESPCCGLSLFALVLASFLSLACGREPTLWRYDRESGNVDGEMTDAGGEDSQWNLGTDVDDEEDEGLGGDEDSGWGLDTNGDDEGGDDGSGVEEIMDLCPNNPDKLAPGICGCGRPDSDYDKDGVPDCVDGCPQDENTRKPGVCGCGEKEIDGDKDGVPDCVDGCPYDEYKLDPGICGCGEKDIDEDGDGVADCVDGCPDDEHKVNPGVCGCGEKDEDRDKDKVPDCVDECPKDKDKVEPGVCGCFTPEGACDFGNYLEASQEVYTEGDDVIVYFSNIPDLDENWIGLYTAGADHDQSISWFYLNMSTSGYVRYRDLKEGEYEVRLFFHDSYVMEDQVSFTVRK